MDVTNATAQDPHSVDGFAAFRGHDLRNSDEGAASASASAAPGGQGSGAAPISLERVAKQYPNGTLAVRELSLEIPAGEVVVLVGPSGCGKSTVLRMINRLTEPTGGRILIDGVDVARSNEVDLRRRIGYVIQNTGLFPHQSVRANVATVPRLLGWSRARINERVDELLELVGLDPSQYGTRYPHELSGGQRQRVGVARALAADPVVLLMDEPFSAVDPIVRLRLGDEFLRLQAAVRKTTVLVTHDIDEAVRLGDRIAVLSEGGTLEQYARPADLLREPASEFVREFVGADRGVLRLGVTSIDRAWLRPASTVDDAAAGPWVAASATMREAFGVLLDGGTGWVAVRDDHGEALGVLLPEDFASVTAQAAAPSRSG